jgi:hypothetical protein
MLSNDTKEFLVNKHCPGRITKILPAIFVPTDSRKAKKRLKFPQFRHLHLLYKNNFQKLLVHNLPTPQILPVLNLRQDDHDIHLVHKVMAGLTLAAIHNPKSKDPWSTVVIPPMRLIIPLNTLKTIESLPIPMLEALLPSQV